MRADHRILGAFALIFAVACASKSEQGQSLVNGSFEQGSVGSSPSGWFVPQPSIDAGYSVRISDSSPKEGKQCAAISGRGGNGFGNMMQAIDATAYRGKTIRFRAAVKFDSSGAFGRAQLWLRIDRVGGQQGFFYNMSDRPITSSEWGFYEIVGPVAADAELINFGMMLVGAGTAWIDAASLTLSDEKAPVAGGPKALTARGLDNLTALTKLLGYVRHFHPSDAVEKVDWDAFTVRAMTETEDAKDSAELAQTLDALFRPIAPTVRVFVTGQKPALPSGLQTPTDKTGLQTVSWQHIGFGGGTNPPGQNIYRSRRVFTDSTAPLPAPFEASLGGGVSCMVPLTLYAKENSALPATAAPKPPANTQNISGDDRSTRLAATALAWNVYQHFYPYFDVVKPDWPGVLRTALSQAAQDADAHAFLTTLRKLVGSAKDGHGYVGHPSDSDFAQPPLLADWIEGKLIVTQVGPGILKPRIGDEILQIDGRKVADLWKDLEPTISGATEGWRRYRGKTAILAGAGGSSANIQFARGTAAPYEVSMTRSMGQGPIEKRPNPIEEIKPGIWYVDLDTQRAKMDDYKTALPNLAKANGIIFDMRGYPNEVAMDVIKRCGAQPVISAFWNVPRITKPDQRDVEFIQSNWPPAGPLEPRFSGKIAFLTDGRAISFAESIMGIVERFKLGEIVGENTAGTNGNINPFRVPGGYSIIFTGMKVVKHDGTTHHGVGIAPTVKVTRTIEGVSAKRDEVLEKAIAVVGG